MMQGRQKLWSVLASVFAKHCPHEDDPAIANLPESQSSQPDELDDPAYLPATHSLQAATLVCSVEDCAVPAGHAVHTVAPCRE